MAAKVNADGGTAANGTKSPDAAGTSGDSSTTDGGMAADHDAMTDQPALIAPSLADERNTVRVMPAPVACWRMDDLRFDFDSSVVLPGARAELRLLAQLVKNHPQSRGSIFGHADPVGTDSYNKTLSGRRAKSVYGLLVRNTDLWEELYTQPFGGDNWGTRSIQNMLSELKDTTGVPYYNGPIDGVAGPATSDAIRRFQTDHPPLAIDGVAGPETRKQIFLLYMDALCTSDLGKFQMATTDFIAKGADPKRKGDLQGCSEFNPVRVFSSSEEAAFAAAPDKTERNQQNSINRRLVLFLFAPGFSIDAGNWPCPRVDEGDAGCRSQFWPDGDHRRAPRDVRREYKTTRDTFACLFYDMLCRRSPCEGIVVLQTLRIHLFDAINRPMPNAPFFITTDDGQQRRGTADRAGVARLSGLRVPAMVTVRWTAAVDGRSPSAPDDFQYLRKTFVETGAGDSRIGVDRRLSNLSYDQAIELEDNVASYQRDRDVPVTGDHQDVAASVEHEHDDADPERPLGRNLFDTEAT
jgi:outer membrane protein OmpA-like peptidoglycan-associated protein